MFIDADKKEKYLKENQIVYSDINQLPKDYFDIDKEGNIILDFKRYYKSERDIDSYATCLSWIMLDTSKMALIKNFFGDIYRNRLSIDEYNLSKYNNILIPEIARQFQNDSAQYYFAKKQDSKNTYLLTMNFLQEELQEELIEGNDILLDDISDNEEKLQRQAITELKISTILEKISNYLIKNNCNREDKENIEKGFIKQTIFNKFIGQTDENNGNWGIIKDKYNRFRIAPIYDVDCSCNVNKLAKKERKSDNEKTDIESVIMQYKDLPWLKNYIEEVINNFNIQKAFEQSEENTNIIIEQKEKQIYTEFFAQRIEMLENAYSKCYREKTEEKEIEI